MNRTGLMIALLVGGIVGLLFGFFPTLDLKISGLFFDPATLQFALRHDAWLGHVRDACMWIVPAIMAPAGLAVAAKCLLPATRMRVPARAVVFLLVSFALGPGLLVNTVLKEHWGRARPTDVREFGGPNRFVPWWDPRGDCPHNCSFVAGEASGAFWTVAPAALAPASGRIFAYVAAVAFGSAVGMLRMAVGAHFFTDVAFAGVLTFLIVWLVHAALYRWPKAALLDGTIERAIERAFLPPRAALLRFFARRSGREPSTGPHPGGT